MLTGFEMVTALLGFPWEQVISCFSLLAILLVVLDLCFLHVLLPALGVIIMLTADTTLVNVELENMA